MLKVLDLNGDSQEVEVIRYFQMQGNNYLLYSLNEVDEQDYLKLYGLKVADNKGVVISDEEWALVKEEIKRIIKGNKEGNLEIDDLNFQEIEGLTIEEFRAFKLSAQLVELLKANKKDFTQVAEEPAVEMPQEEVPTPEVVETPTEEEQPGVVSGFDFEVPTPEAVETPVEESTQEEVPETSEEKATADYFDLGIEVPTPEEPAMPEVEKTPPFEAPEMPQVEEPNMEPTTVGTTEEAPKEDYEHLYKEAQEINKALKGEIDELRNKLNRIAQFISE